MAFMLELNDDHALTTRFDCTFKSILHISRLTKNNNKSVFTFINNGNQISASTNIILNKDEMRNSNLCKEEKSKE